MDPTEKPPPYQDVPATGAQYPPPVTNPPPPPATYAAQPQQPPSGGYAQPQQPGYPQKGGYPVPQQEGYIAPPQQQIYSPTATVVMQPTVTLTAAPALRDRPMNCICPNCHNNIVTSCDYVSGSLTWVAAFIICLIFWPCAWIPFVLDDCKDVSHRCPMCNNLIGLFRRM